MSNLDQFKSEVARLFFSLSASDGYLLAGGGALLAGGFSSRPTEDLDFFGHRTTRDMAIVSRRRTSGILPIMDRRTDGVRRQPETVVVVSPTTGATVVSVAAGT